MRNTENTSSNLPLRDSEANLFNMAEQLVSEFERLVASELNLLKAGQVSGLEAIAEAKQALVNQISIHEGTLARLFAEHSDKVDIAALKERLTQCRATNRNNHALVMLELKHANKTLELLRSVLNMDDLSLYSERGVVQVNREKRKFGRA